MSVSTIHVNRNGSPKPGAKVVLSFASGGVSAPVRTDRDGRAVISHDGSGTAKIIVDGSTRGTMRAPGTISVEI